MARIQEDRSIKEAIFSETGMRNLPWLWPKKTADCVGQSAVDGYLVGLGIRANERTGAGNKNNTG